MSALVRIVCALAIGFVGLSAQGTFIHYPTANPPRGGAVGTAVAPSKTASVQSPQQTQYNHGDPTDNEQLMLELINRARMNPSAEGDSLFFTTEPNLVSAYSYWKVDKAKVRAEFKTYPVRPPLAFHAKAITASRVHSADMRDKQYQGHTGSDGSNPGQRLSKAGYTASAWGENVFAYAKSMWEAQGAFLVDWGPGNEGLGHRHNIMNFAPSDAVYTEVGLGVLAGSGQVGPWVVTQNFGKGFEKYILGVVYKDKNNNKAYDPGEGLSGVKITPSQGNYFAVTSTSGGYAIPMGSVSGSVTVTAQGNGIQEVKQVSISNANVKVDFGQATTPGVILIFPDDRSDVSVDTTKLRWNKTTGANVYHLQVSMDDQFTKMIVNDSALTSKDTTKVLKNLTPDSSYYWRVRAKNTTLGWGDFSPAYTFRVNILPSQVQLIKPDHKAELKNKNIVFTWSQSKPGVKQYWFEIARDTIFMELALQNYELVDTTWTLDDPTGEIHTDTVYYWHVASYKDDNTQPQFSDRRWFIITSAPNSVNEESPIMVHGVAPNPVAGAVQVRFT
ncbi:MAG: CAP domain-containing protein, partial [Candidatus Kapaibacterium sp.]